MKMDVYDFDKTIYDGDSTVDFWRYALLRRPLTWLYLPVQCAAAILYLAGGLTTDRFKSIFMGYVRFFKPEGRILEGFAAANQHKLAAWFKPGENPLPTLVISASPRWIVSAVLGDAPIHALIATEVSRENGRLLSPNCRGPEKVRRLRAQYPDAGIRRMYTDSIKHDGPLLELADEGFVVKKRILAPWKRT